MDKYHGFDQQFYDYLFDRIVTDGGLRLQLIASDLGTSPLIQPMNSRKTTMPRILSTCTGNSTATSTRH